jgi:hypothetical protein
MLGAWGCGRGPASADLQKKQLENRAAKLETDLADTTARLNEAEQQIAREQAKFRTAERAAEDRFKSAERTAETRVKAEQAKLQAEKGRGQQLERDKDDLYTRLKATADQRDATLAQYDTFVKKLEGVLVESKAAMGKIAEDSAKTTTTTTAKAGD